MESNPFVLVLAVYAGGNLGIMYFRSARLLVCVMGLSLE